VGLAHRHHEAVRAASGPATLMVEAPVVASLPAAPGTLDAEHRAAASATLADPAEQVGRLARAFRPTEKTPLRGAQVAVSLVRGGGARRSPEIRRHDAQLRHVARDPLACGHGHLNFSALSIGPARLAVDKLPGVDRSIEHLADR